MTSPTACFAFISLHNPGLVDAGYFGPVLDLQHIDTDDFSPLVFSDLELARWTEMHVERGVLAALRDLSARPILLGMESGDAAKAQQRQCDRTYLDSHTDSNFSASGESCQIPERPTALVPFA